MKYTKDELAEAKRQIDSVLHKLQQAASTLEAKDNPSRYKSQITLTKRRIRAFSIAAELIEQEMAEKSINIE